jgi:hypothetical protein
MSLLPWKISIIHPKNTDYFFCPKALSLKAGEVVTPENPTFSACASITL